MVLGRDEDLAVRDLTKRLYHLVQCRRGGGREREREREKGREAEEKERERKKERKI